MAATKVKAPSKIITVEVRLKKGRIHIDADQEVVNMKLNDQIRWESKNEAVDFWIVFEDRTPFELHALDAPRAQDLRKPLLHGAFKYHIVLHSDRNVRIDPVVVVDPPPDDGPKDR